MESEIISQECFLGHRQPKLLKLFRSAKQDGRKNHRNILVVDPLPNVSNCSSPMNKLVASAKKKEESKKKPNLLMTFSQTDRQILK